MDVDRMNRYLGFDLRPGLVDLSDGIIGVWGKRYPSSSPTTPRGYMIERGPRHSSMDHYLADLAQDYGAKIEVGHPVTERKGAQPAAPARGPSGQPFPRNVIVATGLHEDGYEVANMPFQKLNGVFAKCRVPWPEKRGSPSISTTTRPTTLSPVRSTASPSG